jgi:hypothetical protein
MRPTPTTPKLSTQLERCERPPLANFYEVHHRNLHAFKVRKIYRRTQRGSTCWRHRSIASPSLCSSGYSCARSCLGRSSPRISVPRSSVPAVVRDFATTKSIDGLQHQDGLVADITRPFTGGSVGHCRSQRAEAGGCDKAPSRRKGLKGGVVSAKCLGMEVPVDCKSVRIRLMVSQGCYEINLLYSGRALGVLRCLLEIKTEIPV